LKAIPSAKEAVSGSEILRCGCELRIDDMRLGLLLLLLTANNFVCKTANKKTKNAVVRACRPTGNPYLRGHEQDYPRRF
jgi:hypothetical protein